MIKKTGALLFAVILIMSLFTACTSKKEEQQTGMDTNIDFVYTDFAGKKLGIITGGIFDVIAENDIKATPVYYTDTASGIEDIRKGRIDGFLTDMSVVQVIANTSGKEDMQAVSIPADIFNAPLGAISQNQDLIDRFNSFLSTLKSDGTLDEMQERWIENASNDTMPMPDITLTGENGTLKIATSGVYFPFSYIDADNELKGYSIELAIRYAAYEGMDIEFSTMDFNALIPSVVSGKTDFGIDAVTITDERKKSVLFTDSIYDDQMGILTLKKGGSEAISESTAETYSDFTDRLLGHKTGSIWDQIIPNYLHADVAYYTEMSAGIEDIRKGRLDGFVTDLSAVRAFVGTKGNEDLACVEMPAEFFSAPMGAVSLNQDIVDRFNAFLAGIKADGTLADMQNRWLENVPDLDSPMPDLPLTGSNGTLKIATTAGALPFSYMGANGELKGYSIELVRRFAFLEGMDIEYAEMEFGGMIPYITSGKADLAIADISITEERKKSVLFTDSIYDDRGGIITLKKSVETSSTSDYKSFSGKRFAVMSSSVFDEIADRIFNASEKLYFNSVIDEIQAVHLGKVDSALIDHVPAMVNLSGGNYDDLTTTEVPLPELNFKYAVFSDKQEIIDKYNDFLRSIKDNGIYDEMESRWFSDFDNARTIPDIPLSKKNGVLHVAINASYPPFVYLGDGGQWSGFDIEQFYRFAAYLDMDIEFADMEFGAMLPYVVSGKCDIASSIYYTEERAKSVIFGDTDYIGRTVLVHKKAITDAKTKLGFIEWVKKGIENNLITDNRWKLIVNGLSVTMIISFAAQFFGTVFACLICFILMRKNRFMRWLGNLYCGLIHGTPIVVLLMITYYIIFGNSSISNIVVAITAFTMVEGAIIAQQLKGAIETVDPVEIEAARSIGFSAFKAFIIVTLPQAVRRVLPSYTNGFVELVKATAIVGYIAIQDMTRAGDIIRSRTYDAYFPLLFIALVYLFVTTICVQLFKFILKKINGGVEG